MSYNNLRIGINSYIKEKQVLEPEATCEDHPAKRSQSGCRIKRVNLKLVLRKCRSVDGPAKKRRRRRVNRIKRRSLKLPQVPENIVNLVDILQHENFLKVVDQYFKPGVNNQLRKKSQGKKSNAIKSFSRKKRQLRKRI
nr:uncharacterized protein LOC116425978 [Nomia melanderi]